MNLVENIYLVACALIYVHVNYCAGMMVGLPFQVEHLRSTELDLRRLGIDFARLCRIDPGLGLKFACFLCQLVNDVQYVHPTKGEADEKTRIGHLHKMDEIPAEYSERNATGSSAHIIHCSKDH